MYNKATTNSIQYQYFAKKVEINGISYKSLKNAALILKESRTNLSRKCLDPKNQEYKFIETNLVIQDLKLNSTQKSFFKAELPCEIDNIKYPSLNTASKKLRIDRKVIKKRILSLFYPSYRFLE